MLSRKGWIFSGILGVNVFGHFHLFDGSLDYWEPNLGRGTQTLDANGWLSMNELDHTLVWVGNIMNPV